MKSASLYDCFERHLLDLDIVSESEECFLNQVVENYMINLGGQGYYFVSHATETFVEIREEVHDMLHKKIYGHSSVDSYRESLRAPTAA